MLFFISAWASDVVRFDKMGNARASECETSDKYRLSRFFHIIILFHLCRRDAEKTEYFRSIFIPSAMRLPARDSPFSSKVNLYESIGFIPITIIFQ